MNPVETKPLSASELYALSQGARCKGNELCHWCAGPADNKWLHDDPPPIPFQRTTSTAKNGSGLYVCPGCWLWRLPSRTVSFLGSDLDNCEQKDRQTAKHHSWWVTWHGAWGLRQKESPAHLFPLLLQPPLRFMLSLVDDKTDNLIQCCVANDLREIKADTPLRYTLNNSVHVYTIYELDHALKNDPEGTEPGVQALLRFFPDYKMVKEERGQGRPAGTAKDGKVTKQVVVKAPPPLPAAALKRAG